MRRWFISLCAVVLWLVSGSVCLAASEKDFFKVEQSATAPNVQIARQKALTVARNSLSALINGKVESVSKSYVEHNSATGVSADALLQETKVCTRTLLENVSVADEKVVQEKNKRYTVYVTLRIKKSDVLRSLCNHITENSSVKDTFDENKFSDIWQEK